MKTPNIWLLKEPLISLCGCFYKPSAPKGAVGEQSCSCRLLTAYWFLKGGMRCASRIGTDFFSYFS